MMRRPILFVGILAALAALAGAPAAGAQGRLKSAGNDIKHGLGDIWYIYTSPFHADARDWAATLAVIGAGAALSNWDDNVDAWIVDHPGNALVRGVKPFRAGQKPELVNLGSAKWIHPISGALFLTGFIFDSQGLRDAGMGCFVTPQANTYVRGVLYSRVSRERPRVADGDQYTFKWVPFGEDNPWDNHSFFGGHAANIVGCAAFLGERFDLKGGEVPLYLLAAAGALARMTDRVHWSSDTVLGAMFGYAIGKNIGRRSEDRRERARAEKAGDAPRTGGLGLSTAGLTRGLIVAPGPNGTMVGWQVSF
jgi:hypothetical protein